MNTIGKFVFAFFLLCSSSAIAYDQQYQPGDTGPNGGIITSVTVTSVDSNPVVTTNGDQQTTTVDTTYTESIIEATTNQVVTSEITQVKTRQVSGTKTTNNILNETTQNLSGDVHNYGSSDSVSDTMLIFGPNGGTVTSQFDLNTYMSEEQIQGGFDVDAQADMLNCFNTQTLYQCDSSAGGPADSFTITITVSDGSESYESITNHTIDNGPTSYKTYSGQLTVPQNTMSSSATAIVKGYGYDVGNYDLSNGLRGDGQPTYLGTLLANPAVTITHNMYETVIQQIEQQITNTVTEYITTQLTKVESSSQTITIQTQESSNSSSDNSSSSSSNSSSNSSSSSSSNSSDNSSNNSSNNNNSNDNNSNNNSNQSVEVNIQIEVPRDTQEVVEEIITPQQPNIEVVEDVVVQPEVTQNHIDNMLDTIEVAVSDSVGDIVNMTVELNIDDTGSVQVEIISIDLAPEMDMPNMAGPMPQPITMEEMANDTSMAPPAMDLPPIEMPDMLPEMPEVSTNIASNIEMPDVGGPTDMPSLDVAPPEMVEAISEAVTEMANIDAAPIEMPVAPRPMQAPPTDAPASGDLVIGETNDGPAPMEVESTPEIVVEVEPQQQEPQQTAEAQPQQPEPQPEPEPQSQPEQTAEAQPEQQESQPEQTAEAQPEQQESQPEQQESQPEQVDEAQSEQESSEPEQQSEPQQEASSNESKNETKNSEQKTEQKAQSKQTKTKTAEQKKQDVKQKIAQKILTRVLQNQNITMAQVDATRLTLMTSLADTVGFNNYQSVTLLDRDTWYADTKIYDLPQMVDPFADILTGAQNMQMDSLINSQYGD